MKINLILVIFISVFFLLFSCKEDDESITDPEGAKDLVEQANQALEDALYTLINGEVNEPSDVNFSAPHSLYKQAYEKDSDNLDANFGLALTDIMMMSQDDQRLNDLFNEWDDYMGDGEGSGSVQPTFPTSIRSLNIEESELARSAMFLPKLAVSDIPRLSDIQEIIEDLLLPKLDFAIAALDFIDDNPDFTFTITGRMQGDIEEDDLEIDLTEIYALEVGLNVLKAIANISIAYNVDFFGFDSSEAIIAYSPGGSFLTLREGGAPIQTAKTSLLTALDKLEDGIAFLKAETDDQNNDIIKIGPDGASLNELDDILDGTEEARGYLTQDQVITEDWDDDESTQDVDLTVNFGNLFDNPIQDFKAKLPGYTVAVHKEPLEYDYDWEYDELIVETEINVDVSGYYSYYRSFYYYEDGDSSVDETIEIEIPRLTEVFDSLKTELASMPNLSYFSINVYFYAELQSGTNDISATIYYNYETRRPRFDVYVPEITWDADSFSEWIFPDPTFNGFLPGMTDQVFKLTFGITEDDWDKTLD